MNKEMILRLVQLQLKIAIPARGLTLDELYRNIRDTFMVDGFMSISYTEFLNLMQKHRREFKTALGQLGIDVNIIKTGK